MIDQLLAAWRETRDPRAEAAIVRLGRGLARTQRPLLDPSQSTGGPKLEKAWHEAALVTPHAELDRLLDAPWPTPWEPVLARTRALARFEPDPRIARKLVAVARWHLSRPSVALHQVVAAVLRTSVSATLGPWLDALLAGRGPHIVELYVPVRDALRALVPGVADPALVARAGCGELAPLWEDVYASPVDLDRRAVLADALMLEDDPRGELIQLQLSDERTARGRAARLLARHLDEWIGPLPMVQRDSVRFARGFPVALHSNAGGDALERAFDRPEWRTLERLSISGGDCDLATLLHRMPLLRVLEMGRDELEPLVEQGPFSTVRALCIRGEPWRPPRGMFPNLRLLAGTWEDAGDAQRAGVVLGLDAIVHRNVSWRRLGQLVPLRNLGPPETRMAMGTAPLLDAGGPSSLGWSVRMWRRRRDVELAWHDKGQPDGLDEALGTLANAGFREIRIQCADPRAIHDLATNPAVRAAKPRITFGTAPFALAEEAAR